MSSHGDQALGHRMPLRPIDLRPVWPVDPAPHYLDQMAAEALEYARQSEAKRIWEITRQVAQGTNPPCSASLKD